MKAKKKQKTTWKEIGHVDLRDLNSVHKLPAEEIIETHDSADVALAILEYHLGFVDLSIQELTVSTPVGPVHITRENLSHIVEKRQDARERYVKYALATMQNPFEVWQIEYEGDNSAEAFRFAYIGAFHGKAQMLVVFADSNGKILWNFMHSDNKSLNKHRHGICIYQRP